MGCLSVSVSQVLPTIAVSTEEIGRIDADAASMNSTPSTTVSPLNGIDVTVSKMYSNMNASASNKNIDMAISAWLICSVSLGGLYLAVDEGLILTLDDGYLVVRRA